MIREITSKIYTAHPEDNFLKCNTLINGMTILLFDAYSYGNKLLTIKKTDLTSNSVIIIPYTGQSIDNETSYTLNNTNEYITLVANGNGWGIVDKSYQMIDTITFNTEYDRVPIGPGIMYWDDSDRTLNVNMSTSVTQSVGEELYNPRCVNKTGANILNGYVVYVSGAQGNRPTIDLADADLYATSKKVIGVTTENMDDNAEGFVTTHGLVRGLDTSSYVEGTCLYLSSTPGELTDVEPTYGKSRILVGMVVKSHITDGWVCIRVNEDKYMFGDIDNGNYSYFEDDGTLVSIGDAITYNDLQFSISGGKVPAVNFPDYTTFTTNTREYAFGVDEYIDLGANEIFHQWLEGSPVEFHMHIANKTANSTGSDRYAKFQLLIATACVGEVWTETTLEAEKIIPDGTSALTHLLLDLGNLDFTGKVIGCHIKLRIKRIAATGGTEFADDVFITQVGSHMQQNTMGSRNEYTK